MQKKGVVMVWYDFSYDLKLEAELMIKGVKFVQSVPWRTAGVHFCSTKPQFGSFATFVHFALGRAGRLRFRAHSGKEKETYIYTYIYMYTNQPLSPFLFLSIFVIYHLWPGNRIGFGMSILSHDIWYSHG